MGLIKSKRAGKSNTGGEGETESRDVISVWGGLKHSSSTTKGKDNRDPKKGERGREARGEELRRGLNGLLRSMWKIKN